ncbi:hypothetical protein Q669_29085 [Labrenzia sp. C1B10]|uniref:hypothetical protein n=1 Tax=unclassified Labrenzia TaxID=2648686 RepID=UPI0003B8F98E|nr:MULTISPECIES: hypothetical protein [unclassified Labrenzia]ERP96429.1 hypothetical protein Q669_29085 [Labrenzia sp. C1B10]ERS06945.1 hypothetical protein Q675_24945 [Labrenzia sp. C1B70]
MVSSHAGIGYNDLSAARSALIVFQALKGLLMIVRIAVFKGRVKDHLQTDFETHVTHKMLPLIASFPGISSVGVLRTDGGDGVFTDACLALEMRYPDLSAMERALASPERAQNAKETEVLLAMVDDPSVSHAVFKVIGQG